MKKRPVKRGKPMRKLSPCKVKTDLRARARLRGRVWRTVPDLLLAYKKRHAPKITKDIFAT